MIDKRVHLWVWSGPLGWQALGWQPQSKARMTASAHAILGRNPLMSAHRGQFVNGVWSAESPLPVAPARSIAEQLS